MATATKSGVKSGAKSAATNKVNIVSQPVKKSNTNRLVLTVDDDTAIRKLIEVSLVSAGFAVITFDRARDALEELKGGLRPDVIISDVTMPVMDGFEFCENARGIAELRGVPFIFLTALNEREHVRHGMSLGADDYLTKPFERSEVIHAVERRIERFAEIRKPVEGVVKASALGAPLVEKGGERLDWDSLKALELFFYLLEHPDGVSTFEVAEALWPGKTESKASSSFHTTLYRLRKVMGGEIVESANRRYYLQRNLEITYDAERYRSSSLAAQSSGALEDYTQLLELYRGDFLTGVDSEWAEVTRAELHADHLTNLLTAAEMAETSEDYDSATRFYSAMTEHDPYSETAWEGLANIWELRGQSAKAAETRERFETLMEADF